MRPKPGTDLWKRQRRLDAEYKVIEAAKAFYVERQEPDSGYSVEELTFWQAVRALLAAEKGGVMEGHETDEACEATDRVLADLNDGCVRLEKKLALYEPVIEAAKVVQESVATDWNDESWGRKLRTLCRAVQALLAAQKGASK